LKRRNYGEETVSGVDFGPGKKNLTGGSHMSAKRREEAGYCFGNPRGGPWASSRPGPEWFPGAIFYFFYFLFFFSSFLFFLFPS
jgi:hypothetical protein